MNEAMEEELREHKKEQEKENGKGRDIKITKLNMTLHVGEPGERGTEKIERQKERLPKGTDGKTARLTKIRNKLYSYTKTLKKLINKKKERLELREWNWVEQFGQMATELQITRQSKEEEMREVLTRTNRIIKYLTNKVQRRRTKLLQKDYQQAMKELEQEGWSNSKKFFQRVLKKRKKRISIRKIPTRLMKEEGNDTDPKKIKEMVREYWQQLYSKKEQERGEQDQKEAPWFKNESWDKHRQEIQASEVMKTILQTITEKKMDTVIRKLKNGKAGGLDKVVNEQIKYGPTELWEELRSAMNQILEDHKIPEDWKQSMVYMIHKKDDTNDPDKYRGITLAATAYKIMAKILTKRIMQATMKTQLIHEAQGVAKTGQAVYNEARTLHNIIEDANQNKREIHVCYVDLTKVYDMIEHTALREVLTQTGLDENLIALIMDMNTENSTVINTDFGNTDPVQIQRGIRQGCPLSPLLFCLYIEPLLRWIWDQHNGYRMSQEPEVKIPMLAYMDDLVILTETREEMAQILGKLGQYTREYGIQVSDKSTYTYKEDTTNRHQRQNKQQQQEPPEIQGQRIKMIEPQEAYKYLGYWTNLIGTWEKHKQEAEEKHNKTCNMITTFGADPRILQKVVNVAINTPLEYGFHSVPYKKAELQRLEVKNKQLVKRIWQVSKQCPTSMVFGPREIGGMEIRSLRDLYTEILITDLMELINFTEVDTLYYKVGIQRLVDLEKEGRIKWENLEKTDKEQAQLWWAARAVQQLGEERMKVTHKTETECQGDTVVKWAQKYGSKEEKQKTEQIVELTKKTKVTDWMEGNWMKDNTENLEETHWETIRKILCGEIGTRKRKEEREKEENQETTQSKFAQDLE